MALCGGFAQAASSGPFAPHCTSHAPSDPLRARSRASCHWLCPARWRGLSCQRLSTPRAPPDPGVSTSPSGAVWPRSVPVSAASCSRRIGVSWGGSDSSATASATAPDRSPSSRHHKISSARLASAKISRAGSISPATPAICSRSSPQAGRIHKTGPHVCRATQSASRRLDVPQASCTRAPASSNRPRSATPGRGWRWLARLSWVISMPVLCSLNVLIASLGFRAGSCL